jgi:hypothetical protein
MAKRRNRRAARRKRAQMRRRAPRRPRYFDSPAGRLALVVASILGLCAVVLAIYALSR